MNIIKDYEKAAIAIGISALGLAAYQAHKTKQAADAVEVTDTSKSPISAAVDLAQHTIGNFGSWLHQKVDRATGFTKGKSEEILDQMTSNPANPSFWIKKGSDLGYNATEAGSKYLYGMGAKIATTGKQTIEQLTNKGFTLMGSIPEFKYNASRVVPNTASNIGDALTGVAEKSKKVKESIGGMFSWFGNRATHIIKR